MPLPPPASNATPAADAAPAAPEQNDKPAKPAKKAAKIAQFGPSRGEDAVPVPTQIGNQSVDLIAAFSNLKAAIDSSIGDADDFVAGFEGMNKTQFPGSKEGRVAYDVCRMVKIINQGAARLEGKSTGKRTSKVAALQQQLEMLKSLLTPEQLAQLGG